jgi:hypothetical protein
VIVDAIFGDVIVEVSMLSCIVGVVFERRQRKHKRTVKPQPVCMEHSADWLFFIPSS